MDARVLINDTHLLRLVDQKGLNTAHELRVHYITRSCSNA